MEDATNQRLKKQIEEMSKGVNSIANKNMDELQKIVRESMNKTL